MRLTVRGMDSSQTRRRVKAARAIAGLSVAELAARIDQSGLGERTLRALEGEGGRQFRPMELQAIAQACDLPYEFFTVDFRKLSLASGTLEDRLAVVEDEVRRLARERAAPAPPGVPGHRAEDSPPSGESLPQSETGPAVDRRRDAGG
jgi:uncharacterized small protein (DUF1192 family)